MIHFVRLKYRMFVFQTFVFIHICSWNRNQYILDSFNIRRSIYIYILNLTLTFYIKQT